MKKIVILVFILVGSMSILRAGNMIIDNFSSGISGWFGSGWNATGSISSEATIVYTGSYALKTHYDVTSSWGNYGASKGLNTPLTNWTGYKYLIFYVNGSASDYDEYSEMDIDIYCGDNTTNEVWYYASKEVLNTLYFKQMILRLDSTNNNGVFMDVDWDGDDFSDNFVRSMSNVRQITFLGAAGASGRATGDFWIDNIFITSNNTFTTAEMISPEHNTGLTKNTTVKIKIGYNMTNIVCQLVDASNNYYKYEVNNSNVSYSDNILVINFTNLKVGRNIIAIDAVNKNSGIVMRQFVKDLYVSDYYVIDNFENSDLTEFSTSAFAGSATPILDGNVYNTEYGGNKSLKLIYSTSTAWQSGGLRFTFSEPMDFSDFSALRLFVKGNRENTGRINVAIYDNDNNKLDLNYNEDDYAAWNGGDEISKNFWVKIDIPLNSGSFIDGNTPANNGGYPSGNQIVEFNKIEALDIYFDNPYAGCSGTVYIDDIILLANDYEFVTTVTNTVSSGTTSSSVEVKDFKPVFDVNTGSYSVDISVPDNSNISYKILGINGNIVVSGNILDTGNTVIKWDGKSNGMQVNTGIYFIKIDVENNNSNLKKSIIKRFYITK